MDLLFILVGIVVAFVVSVIGGYILRWFVWLFCFIWEIFFGEGVIIHWISNHDTAMHVICSIVFLPLLIIGALSSGDGENTSSTEHYETGDNGMSYDEQINEIRKRNFRFVDASGAYRRWGDSFIDCQGNWCSWGAGFYDYDGNYIRWGHTFKDSSGAYRRWGDDFVDGAGNWVHDVPQ